MEMEEFQKLRYEIIKILQVGIKPHVVFEGEEYSAELGEGHAIYMLDKITDLILAERDKEGRAVATAINRALALDQIKSSKDIGKIVDTRYGKA